MFGVQCLIFKKVAGLATGAPSILTGCHHPYHLSFLFMIFLKI